MPTLNWASKTAPEPVSASLVLDSVVYPQGCSFTQGIGYPFNPSIYAAGIDAGDHQPTPVHSDDLYPPALIQGDNLAVMSALLPEFAGRINLIYADPPFFTNRRYAARVGRGEDSRRPQGWHLEEGYPDYWPNVEAYLDMLYPRLALMHRLLAPTGTLYLHLDWHANAYARLLLDEIFGAERLLNEIVWTYHGPSPIRSAFNRKHDTILVYTKGEAYTFNVDAVRQPYNPQTIKTFASSPKAGFGKVPDLERGKVPEDWWYFPVVARLHSQRTGYPTQKPEALLERILLASSNPGDLVADFFCGSGTTAVVAARLGRHFIVADAAQRAVNTARSRLVAAPDINPWVCEPFGLWTLATGFSSRDERKVGRIEEGMNGPGLFHLVGQTLSLAESLLPNLDYWEVDPAWDGRVFHSAVQAVRPRKNQAIASSLVLPEMSVVRARTDILELPVQTPCSNFQFKLPVQIISLTPSTVPLPQQYPICVRLVNINGAQSEWVLDRRDLAERLSNTENQR